MAKRRIPTRQECLTGIPLVLDNAEEHLRAADLLAGAGKYGFAVAHQRGGSLRAIADTLGTELSLGGRRVVLDNTWLTRASRSHAIEAAAARDMPVRCVWLDTPLDQAQINIVGRLLERYGTLPAPEQLRALARQDAGVLTPTAQMRAARNLEPPSDDEGWASVTRVPFVRAPASDGATGPSAQAFPGVLVAASVLTRPGWQDAVEHGDRTAPHLVFDWDPDGSGVVLGEAVAHLAGEVSGTVTGALCPHLGGPPTCWCRPPLPGLPLTFAAANNIDLSRSVVLGTGPAHRAMAMALGARIVTL